MLGSFHPEVHITRDGTVEAKSENAGAGTDLGCFCGRSGRTDQAVLASPRGSTCVQ